MKQTLWTKNFTLVTLASALGAIGGIAGGFALSFLVFDETGSTLASALILAIELIPYLLLPVMIAPLMDRLPRKTVLVAGDVCNGMIYACMGLYLRKFEFSYSGYLAVSLLLACLGSVDELAFQSIYPSLIPEGMEQKGYAVSTMLYPVLKVIMMPLAAILLDTLGVAMLLLTQGALSLLAALVESRIRVTQTGVAEKSRYSLGAWWRDIKEAAAYLRHERGLRSIYEYMAVTNGVAQGYAPILIAFFRTAPGMTATMYSLFSVAEFLGRSIGSALQYRVEIPKKKRFPFTFLVYQVYEVMDMCLLWLPYPLMLVNRGICGFLGSNSAIVRNAAVQRYIPEHLRARINAFDNMLLTLGGTIFALAIGALGEVLDYRLCVTLCGAIAMLACWVLIWGRRKAIRPVYAPDEEA